MSLIDQDAFIAIRQNRWVLDCLHMKLRRQSGGTDRYVGGGSIRQTAAGQLEFILHDISSKNILQEIFTQSGIGEWLSAADFWALTATDIYGNEWRAEWVDAAPSINETQPGAIVRGSMYSIVGTRETRDVNESHFGAFASTTSRVPVNQGTETVQRIDGRESRGFETNLWKVDCGPAGSLLVTQMDDGVDVTLSREAADLPSQVGARLEEGLTFVLAAPIAWLVEETTARKMQSVTVHSRRRAMGNPRLQPPINTRALEARTDSGILLRHYLEYALGHPPPTDERHPLAVSIAKVLRASGGTIEDESLALATEVEHLVRAHFSHLGASSSGFVTAVADALKHFAQWIGPEDVRRRIEGALNNMTGTNPRTALKALVTRSVISDRHFQAWEAIRHQAAHGLRSSKATRETSAKNDLVYQLFLLLVFHVVGYDARMTDYTAKNWPTVAVKDCLAKAPTGGASV